MTYQFIDQHKREFPVVTMCRVVDVAESGYYAWRKRPMSQRKREDAELSAHLPQICVTRRQVYGSPRIQAARKEQGWRCSRQPAGSAQAGERHACQTEAPPPS